MEINDVLQEKDRNMFADPLRDLYSSPTITIAPIRLIEAWANNCARLILETLRRLKTKTTVKELLITFKEEVVKMDLIIGAPPGTVEEGDGLKENNALSTLKLLANSGFIKLDVANQFEDSVVVQYHASAIPYFHSGIFHDSWNGMDDE